MLFDLKNRTHILLWQALFLILGTSWLWAPYLNPSLSNRSSLISQYETPYQAYSLLFRVSDIAAGALLLIAANFYIKIAHKRTVGLMLAALSLGLIIDPILTTNCHITANVCHEYLSFDFVLHAIETVATSALFFIIGFYDAWRRKKVVSIVFVLFQIAYGILFVSQLANQEHFNTLSQYLYQTSLIVWLAWFCRDYIDEGKTTVTDDDAGTIRFFTATWAFLNGIIAIVLSLAHLNLVGRIRAVYFTSDNAWLAQHGIIIGVVMLYLSRHLARGERRARQIFLVIIGVEVLKYSIISPHAGLLVLYLVTFVGLFISRDSFSRGVLPLTWSVRIRDLVFMVCGLLLATVLALFGLDRDSRASIVAGRSLDNLSDYIITRGHVPRDHISSVLLAHSISAFILAAVISVLWILFRPNKIGLSRAKDYGRVRQVLNRYSSSSEDYFKLWPHDKNFYWSHVQEGFVAYQIVGSTAFALADPIAEDKGPLVTEFRDWCRGRRLKACFLPVYEDNLHIYQDAGLELMQIGSSAEIAISDFLDTTVKDKWWRWKLNRAKKDGYTAVQSAPPHTTGLLKHLKVVSNEWLAIGGHSERGFALGHHSEKYLQDCVIYYLKDTEGRAVAFTNVLPQFKDSRVMTVDLLRYMPDASNSMPFLLYSAVEGTTQNNPQAEIFDLGFVPFAKAKGPLLAIAKAFSREMFSSRGLEQFKNKFNPIWRPNYMAYDGDLADLAVIALSIEKLMEYK